MTDYEKFYQFVLTNTLLAIDTEVQFAKRKYTRNFASFHEAYAVIKEEIDELWDEIKKKEETYDLLKMRKEALQAAAMLVRMIIELCQEKA